MPTVVANPVNLSFANFTPSPTQIVDPGDGSLVDALTNFNFAIQNLPPVNTGGVFTVPPAITITITPNCQIFTGVLQTPALLSHEQFHYDVGIMCGRAFARHIMFLRGSSLADLVAQIGAAANLHFRTRARILQRRYDIDTGHGTIALYQNIWKSRMTHALASPNDATMGGFWF